MPGAMERGGERCAICAADVQGTWAAMGMSCGRSSGSLDQLLGSELQKEAPALLRGQVRAVTDDMDLILFQHFAPHIDLIKIRRAARHLGVAAKSAQTQQGASSLSASTTALLPLPSSLKAEFDKLHVEFERLKALEQQRLDNPLVLDDIDDENAELVMSLMMRRRWLTRC